MRLFIGWLKERRLVVGATSAAVVVVAGVWLVLGNGAKGDDGQAAHLSSEDDVTVQVERRVLESVLITRGTVVTPEVSSVEAPSPGEGEFAVRVTGLAHQRGAEVNAADVVIELNNRPVLAVPGSIPFFRDLRPGDTGPDVEALQATLRSMGYQVPETDPAVFGPQTQAGIAEIYADAGYEPLYTLGSKAAVDDALAGADAQVAAAQKRVNEARSTNAPDLAEAEQELLSANGERARIRETEGVMLAAREFLAAPSLPAVLVDLPVSEGQRVEPGMQVAVVGSEVLQIEIELTAAQVNELRPDVTIDVDGSGYEGSCAPGEVVDPAEAAAENAVEGSGGEPAEGSSASEGPPEGAGDESTTELPSEEVGDSTAEGDGEPGTDGDSHVMTVACLPLPPLETLGESLRVQMTLERSDGPVLVVPSTAVAFTGSGDAYVEVVDGQGRVKPVEVTVGGEADGFNAVEPVGEGSLVEGAEVRVRRR